MSGAETSVKKVDNCSNVLGLQRRASGHDQAGTVFWSTPDAPIFEVNLGGLYAIGSITLEHDNNDIYLAVYPTGNSVGFAAIGPNVNTCGMNMSSFTFGTPIVASKISFLGVGGDGLYAL